LKQYLIDTDILIFLIKGKFNLDSKLEDVGLENCFISEISIAELKYGAEKSQYPVENLKLVEELERQLNLIPIYGCIDLYAKEKARLETAGKRLDDFDLLIGTTAVTNDMILVILK